MATQGVTNKRFNDMGGGMDVYNSPGNIADNACVLIQNGVTEGTSIRTVPGDVMYFSPTVGQTVYQLPSAPAIVMDGNLRTIGLGSFSDWIIQFVTPISPSAVGYNYVAIITYNKRLGIERMTSTRMSLVGMKNVRISQISWKLTDVFIAAWGSGVANTEMHAWKMDETDGSLLPWNTGISDNSAVSVPYAGIKTAIFHESRIIVGGAPSQPGVAYYSRAATATNPLWAFDFSGTGSGASVVSTGGRISCIFKNNEKLYVGTDTEIYSAYFDSSFNLVPTLFANSGVLSHESHESVNQESFFFDGKDVRRLGYEANILAIKDSSVSDKVRNMMRSVPEGDSAGQYMRDTVSSSYSFPHYKLYVRSQFSTAPDYAFVYNVIDKSWQIETTQTRFTSTISYNGRQLVSSTGTLDIYAGGDYDGHDGQPKPFRIVTKEYTFGDNVDYKRFCQYELFGKVVDEVPITLNFYVDGELKVTIETDAKPMTNGTMGSSVLGATLIGANSNQSASHDFKVRVPLWLEGQGLQVEAIVNGLSYLRLDGQNFQYKFIPAFPIY